MANSVIVTNKKVSVTVGRQTFAQPVANYAAYAGNVTLGHQPNITTVGTLTNLNVAGNVSIGGNLSVGNLVANNANYANYAGNAYSVDVGNVSGIGNIATVNLNSNANTILNGTGNFVALPSTANANYANYAGNAYSVAGANVSGAVGLATYADTANNVAGGNVFGYVANATHASIANSANSVAGANVSGEVANATYATTAGSATTAGTVTTNAQPNITSVGILTGLESSANISAPFFIGNIVGNISGNIVVPGTNTAVLFNQLGNAGASDALKFDYDANVLTVIGNVVATNFSGSGAALTNINGANVSGEVANATYANDAGNAALALYASTANSVAGANVSGDVSGANHANVADSANSVAAGNISGTINYATYAGTANAVAVANVSGIGNIAIVNLDGNSSNILNGTGSWVAIPTDVANANYANFAGQIVDSAQPNITSVGNTLNTGELTLNPTAVGPASLMVNGSTGNAPSITISGSEGAGNVGSLILNETTLQITNTDLGGGLSPMAFSVYGDNLYQEPINLIRRGGSPSSTTDAPAGTNITNLRWQVLANGVTNDMFRINTSYEGYTSGVGPYGNMGLSGAAGDTANTNFNIDGFGKINLYGPVTASSFSGDGGNLSNIQSGNVVGLGNIVSVNLDGNSSNILNGTGSWVTIPTGGDANYANFAGDVINATQSNITAVGNLTTLTVNDNVNANTYQFNPNGITVGSVTSLQSISSNLSFSTTTVISTYNPDDDPFPYVINEYLVDDGAGNLIGMGNLSYQVVNPITPGDSSAISTISFGVPSTTDNSIETFFSVAPTGFGVVLGQPQQAPNTPIFQIYNYGEESDPSSSVGLRFIRRRGNTNARLSLEPNDYLGNIEWRGAQAGGAGPAGSRYPKIAPRVDSTYVADTPAIPAGIDFLVTTNTDYITHSFYSNGEVSFANAVSAGGDVTASNVQVNTNGFMKLATYTVTELTAITGQAGWMACVTDSGSGGNPNGMIAFWDTTNSRWSYVHDNNAV